MKSTIWRGMVCALLLAVIAAPAPALARWLRAESPRFIVYSDGSEKALREDVKTLETFDTLMRSMHGLDARGVPPRKLTVYLVWRAADLRRLSPGLAPNTIGFYGASQNTIYAAAVRTRGVDTALLHEYAHHFMLQYFPYAYPAWAVEGYAEYFMTAERGPKGMEVGRHDPNRGAWLLTATWLPFDELFGKTPGEMNSSTRMAMYYAEAWLVTHYFHSDPARYAKFQGYLRAVGGGADPAKAMEEAVGKPLDQMQKDLKAYAQGGLRYSIYPVSDEAPQITVTPLSPAADALLLPNERLRTGRSDDALLAEVRQAAAKFPDDPLAQRALARAEQLSGDKKTADAILAKRLTADPQDVEALEMSAQALMDKGDESVDGDTRDGLYRQAAALLVRANRVDKERFQTLYAYARARSVEPDFPSDNVLDALLAAREYAPQVGEITLMTAQVLAAKGQKGRAVRILTPLANSPHAGEGAQFAKRLIDEYGEAQDEPAATPDEP